MLITRSQGVLGKVRLTQKKGDGVRLGQVELMKNKVELGRNINPYFNPNYQICIRTLYSYMDIYTLKNKLSAYDLY